MLNTDDDNTPHIPSELLEPNFARLLGVWWTAVEARNRELDALVTFRERVLALDALAGQANAPHAVIAMQSHLSFVEKLIGEHGGKAPTLYGRSMRIISIPDLANRRGGKHEQTKT